MTDTYSFPADHRTRIEVSLAAGRVILEAGDRETVDVEVSGGRTESIVVEQVGGDVVIRQEDQNRWVQLSSATVRIRCPQGLDVSIRGASTDIDLSGHVGELDVRTASGDLRFDTVERLGIKSASGDVRGDSCAGDCTIKSASGDVLVEVVAGRFDVTSASGDIAVQVVEGAVNCSTASGDVTVKRAHGNDVDLRSISGRLTVGFPRGTRLDADVTTLSGRVHTPERRVESDLGDRRRARFAAKTVSGDVVVEVVEP